jgi:hypothetical protein
MQLQEEESSVKLREKLAVELLSAQLVFASEFRQEILPGPDCTRLDVKKLVE